MMEEIEQSPDGLEENIAEPLLFPRHGMPELVTIRKPQAPQRAPPDRTTRTHRRAA